MGDQETAVQLVRSLVPHRRGKLRDPVKPYTFRILLGWLLEVCDDLKHGSATFFRAAEICRNVFERRAVEARDIQGVGCAAYSIAAKIEDFWCGQDDKTCAETMVLNSDNAYTVEQLVGFEEMILETLDFDVAFPSAYQMLEAILHTQMWLAARRDLAVALLAIGCVYADEYWRAPAPTCARAAALGSMACASPAAEFPAKVTREITYVSRRFVSLATSAVEGPKSDDECRTILRTLLVRCGARALSLEAAASRIGVAADRLDRVDWREFAPLGGVAARKTFVSMAPLGEGSYGKVCASTDGAGRTVALKTFSRGDGREPDGAFVTEGAILARLSKVRCPYIAKLDGWGTCNTRYAISMRLESGGTLSDRMRAPLGAEERRNFAASLLSAIDFVHARGFLHLDVKPANLLVRGADLLLCDFSIAEILDVSLTRRRHRIVQTLWYRAPEVIMGERVRTVALDAWSAGCVALDMLTENKNPARSAHDAGQDAEEGQLRAYFTTFGVPTSVGRGMCSWPAVTAYPKWKKYSLLCASEEPKKDLRALFPDANDMELGVIEGLLRYDPVVRMRAGDALRSTYFRKRAGSEPEVVTLTDEDD